MNLGQNYKIPSHVRFQNLDDQAAILDLSTGTYFGLNSVGTAVWEKLAASGNLGEICHELAEEYEQSVNVIEADVSALLDHLIDQKLILRST